MKLSYTNIGLVFLTIFIGICGVWFFNTTRDINTIYDGVSQINQSEKTTVGLVSRDDAQIRIPHWSLFADGNMWSLVNQHRLLSASYIPELVTAPVAHTADESKVHTHIAPALQALFAAAHDDGVELILTSAYRSANDQQILYDTYLGRYGQTFVNAYVARPGMSEHQTGLAVDIATKSMSCMQSVDACSLGYDALEWLKQNATRFGFIQRYPHDKQAVTGISGEVWHYRYVGTELASYLQQTGLTLDEFVQHAAPGYAQ